MNPCAVDLKTLIFDIETTGLFAGRDMIICSGFCDAQSGEVTQFFAESPADEINLIKKTLEFLSGCDAVVTYNGDSFDLPFLLTRERKYGLCQSLPLFWQIDLYRWLKKYWPAAGRLQSLRQKSVEQALGLADNRDDEIGGGECISLYNDYLFTGKQEDKELILLHNGDDVRQLCKIYAAANFLPYYQIACEQGFGCSSYVVREIKGTKDGLKASAKAAPGMIPASIFGDQSSYEYDSFTGDISLSVRLQQKESLRFADLKALGLNGFDDYAGFFSSYLILRDESGPLYRETFALVKALIEKYL